MDPISLYEILYYQYEVKGSVKTKNKEIPRDVAEKLSINANREKLMVYADVLSKANVRARLTGSIDYRDIFDEHIRLCNGASIVAP